MVILGNSQVMVVVLLWLLVVVLQLCSGHIRCAVITNFNIVQYNHVILLHSVIQSYSVLVVSIFVATSFRIVKCLYCNLQDLGEVIGKNIFVMANGISTTPFWHNGPVPGGFYDFPGSKSELHSESQRFHSPVTTGTSVLAIKCEGGVVIAADILGSYGSLARFRELKRVHKINENTVLGVSGDYADFQHLQQIIEQKVISEQCLDDGFALKPRSLLCWLTRHLYYRRSRFDPLWTNFIVGGVQDGQPFLGTVDKLGTAYEDDHIATGYGAYIALPVMRDELAKAKASGQPLSKEDACRILERCMTVLYFRDARSYPKYEMVILTEDGFEHQGPKEVQATWEIAKLVKGY